MPQTIVKRVGGKVKMSKWIREHLPPHNIFVEPFGGSFAVGFAMPRPDKHRYRLVYNDLDKHIWNFFKMLREQPEELIRRTQLTPYSRHDFDLAIEFIEDPNKGFSKGDPIEWARQYLVYNRQSIFGKETGNWCISRSGENICMTWACLPPLMDDMASHLREAYIECLDYKEVIVKWDSEEAMFYCDPPYESVEKDFYQVNKDGGFSHKELREVLSKVEGSWAVSYYDSPMIRDLYKDCKFYDLAVKKHMQTGKKKDSAIEVLIVHHNKWSIERSDIFSDCLE